MGIEQSSKTSGGESDYSLRATDDKITTVLARLRGDIAGIYAQKKIDKLEDIEDTQDWKEFIKEIKTAFSDKSKAVDTEWKIETFQQSKKYIANFMIKFDTLAMKAETNDMHVIFLLKKNVQANIIKTILGYPPIVMMHVRTNIFLFLLSIFLNLIFLFF